MQQASAVQKPEWSVQQCANCEGKTVSVVVGLNPPTVPLSAAEEALEQRQTEWEAEKLALLQQISDMNQVMNTQSATITSQQAQLATGQPTVTALVGQLVTALHAAVGPASAAAAAAVVVSASAVPSALIKTLKPVGYYNREKSGKLSTWLRDTERIFVALNMDPANPDPTVQQQLRASLRVLLHDEAGVAVDAMEKAAAHDPRAALWSYAGLKAALCERFVVQQETQQARTTLFQLKQGKMTAREYSTTFEKLVDEAGFSDKSMLLARYIDGLNPEIANWCLPRR